MTAEASLTGLLIAAGAGTRYGMPKALAVSADGTPWVELVARTLLDAGCAHVVVVLGAAADLARDLVPVDTRITTVVADDWASGMAASVRAGLSGLSAETGEAVLVTLVDVPELPAAVVRRVIGERSGAHGGDDGGDDGGALPSPLPSALRQAVFGGHPGHPVLIGREHWVPLIAWLDASDERDSGARSYLVANGVAEVECGDLFHGDDIDEPA